MGFFYDLFLVDEWVPDMIAFAWVYQYMSYFIETRVPFKEADIFSRHTRWYVSADVNVDAHIVNLDTPKPVS